MKKKLSIGSWAYIFNQEKPTNDFHQVVHMLHDLGYEGVELGSFGAHPTPWSHPTIAATRSPTPSTPPATPTAGLQRPVSTSR